MILSLIKIDLFDDCGAIPGSAVAYLFGESNEFALLLNKFNLFWKISYYYDKFNAGAEYVCLSIIIRALAQLTPFACAKTNM